MRETGACRGKGVKACHLHVALKGLSYSVSSHMAFRGCLRGCLRVGGCPKLCCLSTEGIEPRQDCFPDGAVVQSLCQRAGAQQEMSRGT